MKAEDVYKKYKKHVMKEVVEPIVAYEGKGSVLKDLDGKEYLDFTTGYAVAALGYNNPTVLKKVKDQLRRLTHCCHYLYYSIPVAELAEKLAQITPKNLVKTFFCNSGTEAVEGSIRLARKHSGKYELIALYRSHHGRSMGAASLTGNWLEKKAMGPYLPGVVHVPAPYCYRCSIGHEYPDCGIACAKMIEDTIQYATSGNVAGIFLEPILMDVTMVPPNGYLKQVRRICDNHGILLILDEVQTGFGRTGKMFAIEHWDVEVDIMALGKALGGGLPLGAYIASDRVAKAFEFLDFATSMGGNPLSCVASLETIKIILEEGLVENAARMGDYLMKRLRELEERHKLIGDIRGKGLMVGVELVKDHRTKAPATVEAERAKSKMREKGLLVILNDSTYRILPPLTVTKEEIDKAVDIFDLALREAG